MSLAQTKRGTALQTHSRFFNGFVVASNGILSAGHRVTDDIEACIDTAKLIEALKKCGDSAISITISDNSTCKVVSNQFQATISTIPLGDLPPIAPDESHWPVQEDFMIAFYKASSISNERAKTIVQSSIQLKGETILASNGEIILEVWHGLDPGFPAIIPKLFITAIKRVKAKLLYSLCRGPETLTAWFTDGSWLRTVLHPEGAFPDLGPWLDIDGDDSPAYNVPGGFFEAVSRLAPFSRDRQLYFTPQGLMTDTHDGLGASDSFAGLPVGIAFNIDSMENLRGLATQFKFNVSGKLTLFYGENLRGAIGQKRI